MQSFRKIKTEQRSVWQRRIEGKGYLFKTGVGNEVFSNFDNYFHHPFPISLPLEIEFKNI